MELIYKILLLSTYLIYSTLQMKYNKNVHPELLREEYE